MRWKRRQVLGGAAGLMAGLAAPMLARPGRAFGAADIVVVGGGPGGLTAARRLATTSPAAVTLIERNPRYTTCFFSNHVIGGLRPIESLQFGYEGVAEAGVKVISGEVSGIDRDRHEVTLAGGDTLRYELLILSPGIEFVEGAVPGWSLDVADRMPHAWKAGAQTTLLANQIGALPEGGRVAILAPPAPYRCPPAPYERASLIAHRLKPANPRAKVMIFDPKDHFSKQTLFEDGWGKYTNGMVTWVGPEFGGGDLAVRPETMEVLVEGEAERFDVVNVIPAQQAGRLAHLAGLTDASGWVPVVPSSFCSTADPDIYVVGDAAQAGEMPKGAFAAQSQAEMAVAVIRARLWGGCDFPWGYDSACWSVLAPEDAVKLGGVYEDTGNGIVATESFVSQANESAETRAATYAEAQAWYASFTAELFG